MPIFTSEMNIEGALKKARIIPEVVTEKFSSSTLLEVVYPNGNDVALGNALQITDAAEKPQVNFIPTDENAQYTLVMADPDAPSITNHKFGPWRHWVVVNIPASNVSDLSGSTQHTPYLGPCPGPNTGDHRYIFMLYQQANTDQVFAPMSSDKSDRRNFDINRFATENNLELISVNYFICPT